MSKFLKNTLIYSIAPYIPSLANLLVLPIVTKDLTEFDYGISGTVQAYISAFNALSVLGLSVILNNSFFHHSFHYKWIWRQIYGFLALWNIIYAFIVTLFLFFFIPIEAQSNLGLIIFLNIFPIVFLGPSNYICNYYFLLNGNALPIGLRTAIFGIIAIVLNLLFISYFKLGYIGWFLSTCIVTSITNLSYWYTLRYKLKIKPILKLKKKTILKSLKISLPLIPHQYSYYLLNGSERVIMNQLKIPINQIGLFNIASSFSNIASNLLQAISNSLTPLIMNSLKQNDSKKVRKYLLTWLYSTIILFALGSLWMKEIFYFLINNEKLRDSYSIAIILIMSLSFTPLFLGYFSFLNFNSLTKSIWKTTFLAGVLTILLNLILIPIIGFIAVPITIFFAFMYRGISGYYLADYIKNKSVEYYPILNSCLITAVTILIYYLSNIEIIYKVIITLLIIITLFFNRVNLIHLKKSLIN